MSEQRLPELRQAHGLRELHDLIEDFMSKKHEVAHDVQQFKSKIGKIHRETFPHEHWYSMARLREAVCGSVRMHRALILALENLETHYEGRHTDKISALMAALHSWEEILEEGLNVWTHATSPQSAD